MRSLRSLLLSLAIYGLGGATWAATPCPPHSEGTELLSARMESQLAGLPEDARIRSLFKDEKPVPFIYYGSPAYSQTSTVWIEVKVSDSEIEYCTGVLIGLHWVLSAAHCLNSKAPLEIGFGPGANGKGPAGDRVKTPVTKVVLPDGFVTDGLLMQPGQDLVLLRIGNVDICPEYKRPSPVLRISAVLDATSPSLYAVGYGLTEKQEYGEKRMTALSAVTLTCSTSIGKKAGCQPFREFIASDTEGGLNTAAGGDTCEGDSGGPLFMKKDGRMVVAGITSRGLDRFGNPAATCGYGGIYSYAGAKSPLGWLSSHVPDLQIAD